MRAGYLSISEALRLVRGISRRALRQSLWELHKREGDVLFRRSKARNSKLFTTPDAIRRAFKERFPDDVPALDVLELRAHHLDHERRLTQLERKVGPK